MTSKCALCRKPKPLCESHIIPHFVFRWQKKSSPGYYRFADKPNIRMQDGIKEFLLCSDCEGIFNEWETPFSNNIFYPLHKSNGNCGKLSYGSWCIRFAVSVSWRVLLYFSRLGLQHLSKQQQNYAHKALITWRKFLIAKESNPKEFIQYMFPVDMIESTTYNDKLSPYLNRYLIRSTDMDIVSNDNSCFVYIKMCRILLIGFIQKGDMSDWEGSRIYTKRGSVAFRNNIIPPEFFTYLNNQADRASQALDNISPRQKKKIRDIINKNPEAVANSEGFKSMMSDVNLVGDEAFSSDEYD